MYTGLGDAGIRKASKSAWFRQVRLNETVWSGSISQNSHDCRCSFQLSTANYTVSRCLSRVFVSVRSNPIQFIQFIEIHNKHACNRTVNNVKKDRLYAYTSLNKQQLINDFFKSLHWDNTKCMTITLTHVITLSGYRRWHADNVQMTVFG